MLFVLAVLMTCCLRTTGAAMCLQKSPGSDDTATESCFDLQSNAGSSVVVEGEVCLKADPDSSYKLKLIVSSEAPWTLVRNQVWIGDDISNVPKYEDGSLDTTSFPDFSCDYKGERSAQWTVASPCEADSSASVDMVFVSHSNVKKIDANGYATADDRTTVYGYEHTDGSPTPWFDVTVLCECPSRLEEKDKTFQAHPQETRDKQTSAPTGVENDITGAPTPGVASSVPETTEVPTQMEIEGSVPEPTEAPTEMEMESLAPERTKAPTEMGVVSTSVPTEVPSEPTSVPTSSRDTDDIVGIRGGVPFETSTSVPTDENTWPMNASSTANPSSDNIDGISTAFESKRRRRPRKKRPTEPPVNASSTAIPSSDNIDGISTAFGSKRRRRPRKKRPSEPPVGGQGGRFLRRRPS